jgi:glycosyltransferase involved in cell wall biosynthesis
MKPPTHPTPSGDREMARNLMAAIADGGAQVDLVSDLRLHEKHGNPATQAALCAKAAQEADRLIAELPKDTALWVTYHNYYKAPDLVGPKVCAARGLPYVQIESTRAKSRLTGPWADFAKAAETACDAADLIFYLTANDLITLDRHRPANQRLERLAPFLPLSKLPPCSPGTGSLLSVGMMRAGDKRASYEIIAQTLPHLTGDWHLDIAGDGPERATIATMMAPFGDRVRFLGQLDRDGLQAAYARNALLLWPGVNEAFGMVYLEAQAAGLPVIAQDRPGVRDVVLPGFLSPPEDGPEALAENAARLLADTGLRQKRAQEGRAMVDMHHLGPSATRTFWDAVTALLESQS